MKLLSSAKTIQDQYYIDFEVMKKIIGKKRGEFSKIELIEEVKHNYNNKKANNMLDCYFYMNPKPKKKISSENWRKIFKKNLRKFFKKNNKK
jgi:hypothetical protein